MITCRKLLYILVGGVLGERRVGLQTEKHARAPKKEEKSASMSKWDSDQDNPVQCDHAILPPIDRTGRPPVHLSGRPPDHPGKPNRRYTDGGSGGLHSTVTAQSQHSHDRRNWRTSQPPTQRPLQRRCPGYAELE